MHGLGDAPASRTRIAWLRAVDIEFVRDAILSRVGPFVDVPVVANAPKQFLHSLFVPLFRGANVVVVRDAHPLPQLTELGGNFIRVLLRRLSRGLRLPLNLR